MALFTPNAPKPPISPETRAIHYFGDYELREEIARGGMGIVFRARQVSLNRDVALKLMRDSALAGPEEVRRFRVEAAAAARLKHPNIVAIHEVGEQQGQHYFAMDLIEGTNLQQHTREGPLSAKRAAELVATIADAVQHAHEQGVLHRDLKPSNVLIDANGRPFVTDFGLARSLDTDSSLTMTGQVLGTPGYMPPEQATGTGTVGPAADIYSLGALLYHLLTGRAPFVGGTTAETLRHVVEQEPVSPQLVNPEVPRDLASVCLKCLAKRPASRYASASALAEDLRRFLHGETTHARPAGQTERLWRWCQRKPVVATLSAATSLLLLIVLIGSPIAVWRIAASRTQEQRQRQRAEFNAYAADMNLAAQALEDDDLGRALEFVERHGAQTKGQDIRGWEWRYLWGRCQSDSLATIGFHSNRVSAIVFTPDGKTLITASEDATLKFWEPGTWRSKGMFTLPRGVRLLALSPDGKKLATAIVSPDEVILWEYPSMRSIFTNQIAGAFVFAPDGGVLAIGTAGGQIEFIDMVTGELRRTLETHQNFISALAFSPDGRLLASGSPDMSGVRTNMLTIWNTKTWEPITNFNPHPLVVIALQFSPDSQTLASCGLHPSVRIWSTSTFEKLASLHGHSTHSLALCFSPEGQQVASAGADQLIIAWDVPMTESSIRLKGHLDEVTSLAYTPDGRSLLSGGKSGPIILWNVEPKLSPNVFIPFPPGISDGAESRDGRFAATSYADHVKVWETTGRLLGTLPLRRYAFSSKGQWVAGGDGDGTVTVIAVTNLQPITYFSAHDTGIRVLNFDASGKMLATVSFSKAVKIWDWEMKQPGAAWSVHSGVNALAFAPDAHTVALGFEDGALQLWSVSDGRLIAKLGGHRQPIHDLNFSRDGLWLVSGGHDSTARVWDMKTYAEAARLKGHKQAVFAAEFSPDGSRIVTSGADGTIKFWDFSTKQEVLALKGHIHKTLIAFSDDGRTLITGSDDGGRRWHAPSLEEIAEREKLRAR